MRFLVFCFVDVVMGDGFWMGWIVMMSFWTHSFFMWNTCSFRRMWQLGYAFMIEKTFLTDSLRGFFGWRRFIYFFFLWLYFGPFIIRTFVVVLFAYEFLQHVCWVFASIMMRLVFALSVLGLKGLFSMCTPIICAHFLWTCNGHKLARFIMKPLIKWSNSLRIYKLVNVLFNVWHLQRCFYYVLSYYSPCTCWFFRI